MVAGPEAPLVAGLVDRLAEAGIPAFGPTAAAAEIEGSKAFAKDVMRAAGIPTADYGVFGQVAPALAWARARGGRAVVKADGLAAGKGVVVCTALAEVEEALRSILVDRVHGAAGATVVMEELLEGAEASCIALSDGARVLMLPPAQDHKRIFDGDRGPNTGGMGAFCPTPRVDAPLLAGIERTVILPALRELARRGRPFRGALYAGVMLTQAGPKVLEFNARLGDPETQPILMTVRGDLVPALLAAAKGDLTGVTLELDRRSAVGVVLAAEGYPGKVTTGDPIDGLDGPFPEGTMVFHAGTAAGSGRPGRDRRRPGAHRRRARRRARRRGAQGLRGRGARPVPRDAAPKGHRKAMSTAPRVLILMGSDSDWEVMSEAKKALDELEIPCEAHVSSAHRTPARTARLAREAAGRGIQVIVCGAGAAAHLAGVVAAETELPVLGVPLAATDLRGLDALLATAQMPGGVPVGTLAIGKAGARNAGLLAARVIAVADPAVAAKVRAQRERMAAEVEAKDAALQRTLSGTGQ